MTRRTFALAFAALAAICGLRWATAQQPVGHWPLDEGGGTNTVDVTTNANHGILIGAPLPVWTSGVSSNALIYDGAQNEIVVPDAPALSPTNAITLTAWVRAATNLTSDILGKWATNEVAGSYILGLTNGLVKFELRLDNQTVSLTASNPALPDTRWNLVAGTFDGAQLTVWLNGQAVGSLAATGSVGVVTNADLRVGLLSGTLDDVRLYDQALTAAQISALFAADSDGDGMPDKWEADNGFDPNNPWDAAQDADSDGLNNYLEFHHGANPWDADTDNDGIPDGWDLLHPGATFNDYLHDAVLRLRVYTPLE